jgi:hypothetical protein
VVYRCPKKGISAAFLPLKKGGLGGFDFCEVLFLISLCSEAVEMPYLPMVEEKIHGPLQGLRPFLAGK